MKKIITKETENAAYILYTTGMRSKWITCVKREDFNESIHGYEQYIEAAEFIEKRKKEK